MTPEEQMLKRKEFAEKCEELAKFGEGVPSGGWDIPMNFIVQSLKNWSLNYRMPIKSSL